MIEERNHLPPSAVFVLLVKIAISSLHSPGATGISPQPSLDFRP
jgi:hypothetical protein